MQLVFQRQLLQCVSGCCVSRGGLFIIRRVIGKGLIVGLIGSYSVSCALIAFHDFVVWRRTVQQLLRKQHLLPVIVMKPPPPAEIVTFHYSCVSNVHT